MKTIQFHVRAALPKRLEVLWVLARNVWWSWNADAIALFRRISPDAYVASGPCPLKLLNTLPASTWEELSHDIGFLEHLDQVVARFDSYMENGVGRAESLSRKQNEGTIAYFSMEYGLHESIALYSGGLGVLSGDHLKTASDLNLHLSAVGLFYSDGYFRQRIDKDGWQTEIYETSDPFYMPMQPILDAHGADLKIVLSIGGQPVYIRVWRLNVGTVPLFLLDCDCPENSAEVKRITARLYSGGEDLRIQQEMVLGIGGARALKAMGIKPTVFHLNEGHSAFLALERISNWVEEGLSWREALLLIKGTQAFTVHTPVPAGNDAFPIDKLKKYLTDIEFQYKIPDQEFFNLGRSPDAPNDFSMPVFAIRTSAFRNGVSILHQKVSQNIWKSLWPKLQETEVPINGITNGVHTRTWLANELVELFDRYLGKGWDVRMEDKRLWERVDTIPDSEIWDIHLRRKSRLIATMLRGTEKSQLGAHGRTNLLRHALRPEVLTLGFARRFATYKRGYLIFRDLERLKRLVLNEKCPVQIVIAGKAHPRDNQGKEIIQAVCRAIDRAGIGHRVVFLEDYDMNMAQRLVRGVDVWINTPIRGLEASGTSGMKVALNGGLNFSILDGWWDEGFDGLNGFSIGEREEYADEQSRDQAQAELFYETLEQQIVPTYYSSPVPSDWIKRMKHAISTLGTQFSAQRQVLDYLHKAYLPAHRFYEAWNPKVGDNLAKIKNYLQDVDKLKRNWDALRILDAAVFPSNTINVGQDMNVTVTIKSPYPEAWIEVSLMRMTNKSTADVYGDEQLTTPFVLKNKVDGDTFVYSIDLKAGNPGVRNYSIRITPCQNIFPDMLDLHLITRYE